MQILICCGTRFSCSQSILKTIGFETPWGSKNTIISRGVRFIASPSHLSTLFSLLIPSLSLSLSLSLFLLLLFLTSFSFINHILLLYYSFSPTHIILFLFSLSLTLFISLFSSLLFLLPQIKPPNVSQHQEDYVHTHLSKLKTLITMKLYRIPKTKTNLLLLTTNL